MLMENFGINIPARTGKLGVKVQTVKLVGLVIECVSIDSDKK